MSDASDRRRFLRSLLRSGVEAVREVSSALGPEPEPPWEPELPLGLKPLPAAPVPRRAGLDDLREVCLEAGLPEARVADAERLARGSLRLTRAAEGGRSRLGGVPDVGDGFEWPVWRDLELDFLGQIDLAEVAGVMPGRLPADGLLLLFAALGERPTGLSPDDRGSCRAILAPAGAAPATRPARLAAYPLELSVELMLPQAYSLHVEPLDLDTDELDAWETARERLAERQGVVLEERTPDWYSLHRLLGYADPAGHGEMELDCQLASNGLDLREGQGYFDPRRTELEPGARDWRLLLQLSSDDALGLSFGDEFGRAYLWLREDDLETGRFDRAWLVYQ